MGATFWFGLFVLCYHLLAVDGLTEKGKSEYLNIQEGISWQQGQGEIRRAEGLLPLQQKRPRVGLERRQESTFSLDQGLSNTEEDTQNTLPIGTTEPNAIAASSENCQPLPAGGKLKARGGKERRAPPPGPKIFCPLPSTTGTDTPEPGQQPQPPTTGNGSDEREGGQAPGGGTPQGQPLAVPKSLRIPINDGDNPACYDATNGLMPVGVCQNPEQSPQPSKYDVFMSRNIDIFPRAWKLIDSQPGVFFLFLFFSPLIFRNSIPPTQYFY